MQSKTASKSSSRKGRRNNRTSKGNTGNTSQVDRRGDGSGSNVGGNTVHERKDGKNDGVHDNDLLSRTQQNERETTTKSEQQSNLEHVITTFSVKRDKNHFHRWVKEYKPFLEDLYFTLCSEVNSDKATLMSSLDYNKFVGFVYYNSSGYIPNI